MKSRYSSPSLTSRTAAGTAAPPCSIATDQVLHRHCGEGSTPPQTSAAPHPVWTASSDVTTRSPSAVHPVHRCQPFSTSPPRSAVPGRPRAPTSCPGPNFGYINRSIRRRIRAFLRHILSFGRPSPPLRPHPAAHRASCAAASCAQSASPPSSGSALDALRAPLRRNLVARHAPHLFRVALEEGQIKLSPKPVDQEVLKTPLRPNRPQTRS